MRYLILFLLLDTWVPNLDPNAPIPPLSSMKPPFHVENPGIHDDGGTVVAELVDANGSRLPFCFDGRTCNPEADSVCGMPKHVFLGAYPSRGRPLPLWGSEERYLIRALQMATPVREKRPGMAVNRQRLVESVQGRARLLAAVSKGRVADANDALDFFGFRSSPVSVQAIDSSTAGYELTIGGSEARPMVVRLDPRPDSRSKVRVHRSWALYREGQVEDRLVLELVRTALPAGKATPRSAAIRRLIASRSHRILLADRHR